MDIISFNEASTANSRIESFIENPDSTSGIVTVPKVIASGETVTIPTGRVAVLPNVQVDGVINIEGEVFIPSGATFGDLDAQIALKADTSYVNTQLGLKQNVLVANDPAVKTALNASSTAPIYACRAWVNFNGTETVAIRASGNVSSITDIGVGNYVVNLTSPMPDANYVVVSSTELLSESGGNAAITEIQLRNINNITVRTSFVSAVTNKTYIDSEYINIALIR